MLDSPATTSSKPFLGTAGGGVVVVDMGSLSVSLTVIYTPSPAPISNAHSQPKGRFSSPTPRALLRWFGASLPGRFGHPLEVCEHRGHHAWDEAEVSGIGKRTHGHRRTNC